MRKISLWVAFLPLLLVSSCFLKDELNNDPDDLIDENQDSNGGSVYYKWVQKPCEDCNSCQSLASNLRDDNNAVPDYALENYNYGSCEPGTYNGEYYFGTFRIIYKYTLEAPPEGYDRYYTHLIMSYNSPLNRCVDMTEDPSALTYVDVPAGSAAPGSEDNTDTSTRYVQFYADPTVYSRAAGLVISSIVINEKYYYPKSFIDDCTELYMMTSDGTNYGREKFSYEIIVKNYNSLEAAMNGLEYTIETGKGIIYLNDLKPGCNTLETSWINGYKLFIQ